MENLSNNEFENYQSSSLLVKIKDFNENGIERTNQIIEELEKRGFAEQVEETERSLIKKFPIYGKLWRRALATAIDWILIGLIGMIIGFVFQSFLAQLGSYGFLIGLFIAAIYFGIMNSKKYGGQSIGKKLCKLRVVDSNQSLLSFEKSFLRFSVFIAPFVLNWIGKFDLSIPIELGILLNIVIIALFVIIPAPIILNNRTRQGLHDLCLGTYVVNTDAYPKQELFKSQNSGLINSSLIAISLAVIVTLFQLRNTPSEYEISELRPLKTQIDKLPLVVEAGVNRSTTITYQNNQPDKTIEFIQLNIFISKNILFDNSINDFSKIKLVKDAISIILNNYHNINRLDYIQVQLIYGFNIGISSSYMNRTFANSIDEWRATVQE